MAREPDTALILLLLLLLLLLQSTDGFHFKTPVQEELGAKTAMANGALGDWNGGILMGVWPPGGIRDGQWTHAVLTFADSGAHFSFAMREQTNFSVESIRDWGQKQFFGSSIDQWPQVRTHATTPLYVPPPGRYIFIYLYM